MTWLGRLETLSAANLSRSPGAIPANRARVYFVAAPERGDAAALMCSGVRKSGCRLRSRRCRGLHFHRLRFAVDREVPRGQLRSARRNFHGQSTICSKKGERKLWACVEVFNQVSGCSAHLHDSHFAPGVLGRIGSVGGVNHDRLARFFRIEPGGACLIGRPEHVADLTDRFFALVTIAMHFRCLVRGVDRRSSRWVARRT